MFICGPRCSSVFALYLITDCEEVPAAVAALKSGAIDAVQLRDKASTARALLAAAGALRTATRAAGARLLINDRIDVALACEADGVHLPGRSCAVGEARALLGPGRLIGVSTHAPDEVAAAAAAGADFAVFGPVFDTPSKRAFGAPQGVDALRRARDAAGALPLLAIGGIDATTAAAVRAAGADGIAVIRAILAAADPAAAATALRRQLEHA